VDPHRGRQLAVSGSHVSGLGVTQVFGQVGALVDHGPDLLAGEGGRGVARRNSASAASR